MSVDYYVCDNCGDTFPDCGVYYHCEGGKHMLCECCEPKNGWPEEAKTDDHDYGCGFVIKKDSCPVCKNGGNSDEKLADATDRIRRTRIALLRIWPNGKECEHEDARQAFIALGDA